MSDDAAVVRAVFDETAEGRTQALAQALADDCRWSIPGSSTWSRSFHPKAAIVTDLFVPLMTQLGGTYAMTADVVLDAGDRVVVQAQGTGRTTRGDRYDQTYCFLFRLQDGAIVDVVEYCDTALIDRVLDPLPYPDAGARRSR